MTLRNIVPALLLTVTLGFASWPAAAQVIPIQNGEALTLKVTATAGAAKASRADLLVTIKKLKASLQASFALPITQIDLINPSDGSIIATFTSADWQ